jgi:hypothetical protein
MKHFLLFFFLFFSVFSMAIGQNNSPLENVVITSNGNKTRVSTNENGELLVNVSPKEVRKFKSNGLVRYSDFGAKGDGKTDDMDAIAATHAFANQNGLSVKADEGATYFISGKDRTAVIQTDTDFGTAAFIIDDTNVENRNAHVFMVSSGLQPFKPEGITSLERNQEKVDISLPGTCLITVTDANVKRYIRFGPNQNSGSSQTDIFIVDKNGNVDMDAPIIWDFDQITEITALPIDETTLTITGGRFTTIANKAESRYTYYSRGIAIRRSNVLVDGLEHRVTGEGDHGAPYGGFINVSNCAYVTVQNTILTGHKTYRTIGSAGVPVSMGTYDISLNRALNVSFINCSQTNDINDGTYWGIMGSNFCKILFWTIALFPGSMLTWELPMPPSAIQPWVTWESMPSVPGPLLWRIPPSGEGPSSTCAPIMAVHGRENSLSVTAFSCLPVADQLVQICLEDPIPGNMISVTPVICRSGLQSKTCISTIPAIRRITRDRPFLPISIQK